MELSEGSKLRHPEKVETSKASPNTADDHEYPSGLRFALLMVSLYISMFLVALDKLIISTATPEITNEFHAEDDVGWYGTAYLLTNCAFLLVFGKLYTFLNVKTVFLCTLVLFEVGSAICGAAPNSVAFIIGRAIAGLGAAGVQEGILVLVIYAVPLPKRPQYQGLFGAVYGISSIIGPLIGGAFTSNVTWRWCFYINLPLGGVVLLFIFFLLQVPTAAVSKGPSTWKQNLQQLNIEGVIALLPGWSNGRIIALLTVGLALLIAFILIQIWRPKTATVPVHIFTQRSILSGFWVSCCVGVHMTMFVYYLPIWFQAVKGNSAVESGIHLLPLVIAMVVSSIIAGVGTTKTGYYTPFLIAGTCIVAIGSGLLTMLEVNTSTGKWIGYQIMYGFGLGGCFQAPNMAAQTVLPRHEVAIGASLMLFGQTLFSAIFVSVGQNVLDQHLSSRLAKIAGIHITPNQINTAGITGIFELIPTQYHGAVLQAYNASLHVCYIVALTFACLSVIGSICMEWRNVKNEGRRQIEGQTNPTDEEVL
ncbi:hypothetical protein UA08_05232 [Talaromyces atroroseus]|uniref:Major facilitator superfamily (MFS) profile domain-containing protein n=1 Tax=Talaromyces atroroseus TaxID=1441469 RepID=A0A225AUT7_TALAT|nr:hypothetical protein UA08_05232 [Talaromyces atroroseus]OKL59349.1 hypothetical protein UA08_05232 [Talaromyces atroroseus]